MNKEEIERIALEVADSITAPFISDESMTRFAHRFLARIDAERGKQVVAFRIVDGDDVEYNGIDQFSCGRTGGEPLFLYPAIQEGWSISRSSKDYDLGQDVLIVKKDGIGGYAARPNDDNIASEILHALASDLIAAQGERK